MIKGINTMFYSSKAKELREFLRDKIGFKATDIGDGWLVFDIIEGGDMGVESSDESGQHGKPSGTHHISFYCDNIDETVKELKSKDVEFKGEIEDLGWGLVTYFKVPGDFFLQLYQPKYKK
ncbi:VOC family protein [Flavobacteriaceae bacterium 3-367]